MMQSILLVTVALCLAVTFIMLEGFKLIDHLTWHLKTFIAIIICMLLQLSMLAFILGV